MSFLSDVSDVARPEQCQGVETDSCNQSIKGALESKFEEH